jgi:hypothetical protein
MANQYKPYYGNNDNFDIDFSNIDFADFKPVDMNLLANNATFAQEVANKRLDALNEERKKLLEDVKLHKRFDNIQQDLVSKIDSVLQNAGNIQLSDNANYNRLNSSLTKLQTDPVLKRNIYTSEQAKKYSEILDKNPNLANQPWNDPNYDSYKKFIDGYSNDFELKPIYKEVDLIPVWDDFFSKLPKSEQNAIVKYGINGIAQAKKEGLDVDQLVGKIQNYKNFIVKNNPEVNSNLERRKNYAKSQGLNGDEFINNYIDDSINASASKFAGVNESITNPQEDIDKAFGLKQAQENRMAAAQKIRDDFSSPYQLKGTLLYKGSKLIKSPLENSALLNNIITSTFPTGQIKLPGKTIPINIKPSSIQLSYNNNTQQYYLTGQAEGPLQNEPWKLTLDNNLVLNSVNSLNAGNVLNPSTNNATDSGTPW